MKIYVAGPMSNMPEWNVPAFTEATERLRALGHEVENPAETGVGADHPWEWYLNKDLPNMMKCEAVACLEGWERSSGACLELYNAKRLRKQILDAYTLQPLVGYENKLKEAILRELSTW